MASSKDKKKNKLAQSSASWLGVKPGQLNKNIQTANKTVQQAQKQNSAASRSNVQSSASWKGVTPSQVARPVQAAKPAQQPKPSVVSLPTITPGRVSLAQQQRNAVQSARTLVQNDNSMRARIARSHEAERQRLAANAAAIKQDKSRLASNSILWHQTTDASRRRRLEQENAAIRTRRGFGYDARTGSTFDTKGNELSLGARMIYGGKAETAKQFQQVAQTRDFVRDTSRTASQPSIYDVARGVQADDPYYALEAGRKAHNIVNGLLNRSGDTWTDADTKARDDARTALQSEMTALFRHYGVDYQPRWNEQQTAAALRNAGADEDTVAYAMENVHLRDSTDRLGQGLEAIGKRAVASIPSLIDTAKQALANRNEDYENDEYRSLTEREQALEAQLQSMVSQNADGSVPEDYQRVYDELQNVRNRANALKTTKGVNPNTWSQTMLREANEAQANAEAGLAPAPRWLTEQAISLAGNAPSMAISALPGGTILGSALIGAQAAGQRTFELNEQGKSAGEALGRGLVSGVIEAATEKLPLEQMSEILRSGGTGAVKSILRQMGTEATEEGISYFLNYVSDRAASDPDAKFSLAELVQSAAGGAFGGLVFGAAGTVGAKLAQRNEGGIYDDTAYERDVVRSLQDADAQLRAARSLPEGAGREAAVSAAREKMSQTIADYTTRYLAAHEEMNARDGLFGNPDGTANGFAGKKIPTYDELIEKPDVRVVDIRETPAGSYREQRRNFMNSEEAQQLYRQPVTNYDTGEMVFVTPKTLEHSFSNGGQLQISAAKQIQQIIAHSVLTSAEPITHGDSNATGIYTLFGAVQTENGIQPVKLKVKEYQINGQSIPQNIAEYFRQYGVPEQYASAYDNKVLSLESIEKEEASSSVQPTLAAKQTAQGEYPSASSLKDASSSAATMPFGVNDPSTSFYITVADLMGLVNGEARRYLPNENKSINQTLDGRLQLPGLLSDDTLAANSIRQNAGNSNTSDTNIPLSEAMQYGKTPEQAVMEARAKAEASGISPNTENGNSENAANRQASPLGNYEMYGKSREQAMRELQNKLTEKRSFLHDDDYKQVRAVQSAELRETWEQARPVQEQIEKFQKNHPLSTKDEQLLQAAMVNGATDTFSQCDDPAAVMHRYQLQQELNRRMQPIKDYQRTRGETMALNAEEMADTIAEFAKDKKIPGAYSRETMERNSYDIFGKNNRDKAEQLNDEYFAPVHKAVADRTNYVNTMRQQVADLHLSKHESALVQMALEERNDVAAEYIKNNNIKITSKLQKNVADGVATFQAIYKELYDSLNETLLSNGMEPVRARKNYAPHFVKDKPDTVLSRIRYSFGWGKDSSVNIGTDIAGITDDFKPGKKWFGNLLHREGMKTDYDAVAGFDRYIETAGDVIFLTDSVQQLRSLEDALRYRLSDEGTREKVNQIRNDRNLNALERHQKIDEAYNSNQDNIQKLYNQKKQGMGGYVSNLHEYINNLAGKKARADRGWEELIGRQMYTVAKNVEGRVAANMIAANPGSWITNFIPITQVSGEVSTANIIRAMRDTVKSAVKDDGFTDGSVFLTNREGTQFLDRTLTRKVSDIAGMPMEAIDHFTSNVVTRAKYLQNIQNGMNVQEAFDNADTFAANLMADRSKGAQPTAFNSVNPIRKVFTMFQLEVNNQLSYLFKDLPRAKQSVPKLAWAYTKVFTGAYLFNAVYHQLTGRDSAFDPIGMIADAFGFDPLDDDEDKKKKSGVDIALDLGKNAAEQIPFVGGLIGGGRVPISAAFPDFGKLIEEYENGYDKKRIALDAAKSAANSAAYLLLPFGGGALKRTAEGAATVYAGGSYSLDKNGEKILQFPQYGQSPRDWAQAMLFGKSSLKTAQDWAENGYDTLSAKETKAFDTLRERMSWHRDENGNAVDNSEAVFAAIKAMRAISDETDDQDIAAGKIREMLFNDSALSAGQKNFLDRELVNGGESGVYTSRDAFDISQTVREGRQLDAAEAVKHGITVSQFATWDNRLKTALDDNLVDAADYEEGGDNKLYAKNAVLSSILSDYMNNPGFTDAEKQAFADYVIISAMSKTERVTWNEEVKGKVNASDYVKFKGDLAAFKKEFKGTGVDTTASVQAILDSYTNLSDEQKSVLMHVYSDSAINDPFHVSSYEQTLANNDYYKSLDESEKKKLRANCNEYEQAINENKELKGWKAKAYMAKEAGIEPGTYALFQTALSLINADGGTPANDEITQAVKLVSGISDSQRAYLWQAAYGKETTKNNPWGGAKVTKYQKRENEAVNPVEGGTISSGFGWRQSFQTSGGASSSNHKAIDIAAPQGTPVKAAMSGKIVGMNKYGYGKDEYEGYGVSVTVDCGNGITMAYHHMVDGSNANLNIGDEVKAGQQIGQVGSTGKSTGPHLDFQVVKDGNFVDPRNYIPGYGEGTSATISAAQAAAAAAKESRKSTGGSKGKSSGGSSGLRKPSALKGLPVFR